MLQDKPPSIKDFVSVERAFATLGLCKPCYYVKRGSFQKSKQRALSAAMEEHPPVKEKLLVRPSHVFMPVTLSIQSFPSWWLLPNDFAWVGCHAWSCMRQCCCSWLRRCTDSEIRRFDALRSSFVQNQTLNPKKKARHERCNLEELVKRSQEDYVDFQTATCNIQASVFVAVQIGLLVCVGCRL